MKRNDHSFLVGFLIVIAFAAGALWIVNKPSPSIEGLGVMATSSSAASVETASTSIPATSSPAVVDETPLPVPEPPKPKVAAPDTEESQGSGAVSIHGAFVAEESASKVAVDLRAERNLREITSAESDSRTDKIPAKTYFFVSGDSLSGVPRHIVFSGIPVRRSAGPDSSLFELQKYEGPTYYLVGYSTGDEYFSVSKLDGSNETSIAISPKYSSSGTNFIVQIPLSRIVSATTNGGSLDLKLK